MIKLTKSCEDYLETILILQNENKNGVKSVDIASHLNVSKPAVNKATNELKEYGFNLLNRPMIVAINKVEDDDSLLRANEIKKVLVEKGYEVYFISSILHENVDSLMKRVHEVLVDAPIFPLYENKAEETKVYNAYDEAKKEYEVVRTGPHSYQIRGERIERTYSLINLSTDEGISKLLSILRNLGVDDTLKEMGLEDGDIVTLCDFEFEYFN